MSAPTPSLLLVPIAPGTPALAGRLLIDAGQVGGLADLFKVLGNDTRLRLLHAIHRGGEVRAGGPGHRGRHDPAGRLQPAPALGRQSGLCHPPRRQRHPLPDRRSVRPQPARVRTVPARNPVAGRVTRRAADPSRMRNPMRRRSRSPGSQAPTSRRVRLPPVGEPSRGLAGTAGTVVDAVLPQFSSSRPVSGSAQRCHRPGRAPRPAAHDHPSERWSAGARP